MKKLLFVVLTALSVTATPTAQAADESCAAKAVSLVADNPEISMPVLAVSGAGIVLGGIYRYQKSHAKTDAEIKNCETFLIWCSTHKTIVAGVIALAAAGGACGFVKMKQISADRENLNCNLEQDTAQRKLIALVEATDDGKFARLRQKRQDRWDEYAHNYKESDSNSYYERYITAQTEQTMEIQAVILQAATNSEISKANTAYEAALGKRHKASANREYWDRFFSFDFH
ncbi:MAG: hypothetical protein WCT20_00495 [Candidatus Babeliales bacterium]